MKKIKSWRIFLTICSILAVLVLVVVSVSQVVQASTKDNKALFQTVMEAFVKGDMEVVSKYFGANLVDHNPSPGQAPGLEGIKQMVTMFHTAFPDMQATIEVAVAEGDKVAARMTVSGSHKGDLMGMAPTGKKIMVSGIDYMRIADGKFVERWGSFDDLGMMQQLGVIPMPPGQTGGMMAPMPAKKEKEHAHQAKASSSMSMKENKSIVRHFFEEIDKGKGPTPAAEALLAPEVMIHIAGNPDMNLEAYKQFGSAFYKGFPDLQHTVDDQIAEEDKVATRLTVLATHKGDFMGLPPSGKQVTMTGVVIDRFAGGKITERWVNFDALGLMQQLGVVPK